MAPTRFPIAAIAFDRGIGWAVMAGPSAGLGMGRRSAGSAAGAPRAAGPARSDPVTVLRTTDGGRRWRRVGVVAAPYPFSAQLTVPLAFTSPRAGVLSLFDPGTCAMHGCGLDVVLATADGGRRWHAVTTHAALPLDGGPAGDPVWSLAPDGALAVAETVNLAACAPPATVLAVGPAAALRPVDRWPTAAPVSLDWLGRGRGWAVTLGAAAGIAAVVRTRDGGRSWQQVLPLPSPATAVGYVTPAVGFGAGTAASAGAVLTTVDGGRRWSSRADLGGAVLGISAVSPRLAFAAVETFPVAAGGPGAPRLAVDRTTDGGRRWVRLPVPERLVSSPGTFGPGLLDGWPPAVGAGSPIRFFSAIRGELVTAHAVLVTSDGGRRWRVGYGLAAPAVTGRSAIATAADLVAPGRTAVVWSGPGQLVATADGGRRWERVADGFPGTGLQFVTPSDGWAWGDGAALLHTIDGGRTWALLAPPWPTAPETAGMSALVFIDRTDGWAVRPEGLWRTGDGGRSWEPLG